MATPTYSTMFWSIPAPPVGADGVDVPTDALDGDDRDDAALDRADAGAAQDPVGLLVSAFWPWRRDRE